MRTLQLGAVKDLRPILEKGDNFRVPEEKAPQRFVAEFLTGKGGGGKPTVEFRRRLGGLMWPPAVRSRRMLATPASAVGQRKQWLPDVRRADSERLTRVLRERTLQSCTAVRVIVCCLGSCRRCSTLERARRSPRRNHDDANGGSASIVRAPARRRGIRATLPVPMDWPEQQVKIVREEKSPNIGSVTLPQCSTAA